MWGEHIGNWAGNFCGFGQSFGHGPWFLGWIFPLLFWGGILFIIYSLSKSLFRGSARQSQDSALEILRNRFASGEISEKEYTAQKVVLNK